MATNFKLSLDHESIAECQSIAHEIFQRVDDLELRLSRFVADSDISRISRMKAGQEMHLDYETWTILKRAMEFNKLTFGVLDVGVGEHMNIFRGLKQGVLNESEVKEALAIAQQQKSQALLLIDPDSPKVYCEHEGIKLDLGAIGKGFALDSVQEILQDWRVRHYSLKASDSTILVGSENTDYEWTYNLTSELDEFRISLNNCSVSASGTYWQGAHIFDPRTGSNSYKSEYDRVWVCCDDATTSDAMSTAFFMLSKLEIISCIEQLPAVRWVAVSTDGKIEMLWQKETQQMRI
ncbi:MAG: FAD:protein FMN transferase [Cyclobacteriaceae bacterium]|nr:FAD:protein FMN transferase [Cyclobacteriaceae bacterium HetDA_MAG_MS6]